jgi:hypothetical protein
MKTRSNQRPVVWETEAAGSGAPDGDVGAAGGAAAEPDGSGSVSTSAVAAPMAAIAAGAQCPRPARWVTRIGPGW